jgi:hypothetical protein
MRQRPDPSKLRPSLPVIPIPIGHVPYYATA